MRSVVTGISGSSLTQTQLVERTLMSIVYVALSMLGVAAMALLLSTFTDSPLGAALGALAFLIASTLLLTLDAAASLQPYLPTRYWLSFVDLFRDPILWRDLERGVLLQGVYVLVFLAAAWANFTTKDITRTGARARWLRQADAVASRNLSRLAGVSRRVSDRR